jgi:polyhydroxybutyrate depolymerase
MKKRIITILALAVCAYALAQSAANRGRGQGGHVEASIRSGWQKVALNIDGAERLLLWKGPPKWEKGAIIVMHGGGANYANWCYAPKTGIPAIDKTLKAQVDFSNAAIDQGFAVFSLDSSADLVTDEKGLPCGKRFDATVVEGRKNVDLPFIEKVIRDLMPAQRPSGSSPAVFITGESTGGFMTVRAATHLDGLITAFAPGAACDPYGTYFDASVDTGRAARGVAIDRETGKRITEVGAGGAPDARAYPHEKEWATMNPAEKPPFLSLHHEDDGIVDYSCHVKLVKQLRAHGYIGEAFVIKGIGNKSLEAHLWQAAYNAPTLKFFSKAAATIQSSTATPLAPSDHRISIAVNGANHEYMVHVPRGYDGKKPVPVVVMFHGGGGVALAAMKETHLADKADQACFLAVFPEGTAPDPTKPGNFRTNPQTWNDGSGRFHAGEKNIDDAVFVRALLDDLSTRFTVDARRIYLTGFSNGSSLTYRLGVELSDRIAAIAPIASSGLRLKDPLTLKRPVPMITIQGTADPRNPIEGGDVKNFDFIDRRPPIKVSVERWAKLLSCPAEPQVLRDEGGVKVLRYGPGKEGSEIHFFIIEGMGHTWPGGESLLPESLVGKTTDKLKANDVIWEFFAKHPMPEAGK